MCRYDRSDIRKLKSKLFLKEQELKRAEGLLRQRAPGSGVLAVTPRTATPNLLQHDATPRAAMTTLLTLTATPARHQSGLGVGTESIAAVMPTPEFVIASHTRAFTPGAFHIYPSKVCSCKTVLACGFQPPAIYNHVGVLLSGAWSLAIACSPRKSRALVYGICRAARR
jgi:hypothetical protein